MATIETPGRLLTVAETAQRLRLSRQSVYRRVTAGVLPAVRLGGPGTPLRFPEEIEAWLEQGRVSTPSAAGPDESRQSSPPAPAGNKEAA